MCQACLDIAMHWRTHNDPRRLRRHLMQRCPEIRTIVRNMAGNDHLDDRSNCEPMQLSPVHEIWDVVRHLNLCLQSTRFESMIICDGAEMLKQDTCLGTLAKITGEVEISLARLNSRQPKMVGIWLDMQAMFWFVRPCAC